MGTGTELSDATTASSCDRWRSARSEKSALTVLTSGGTWWGTLAAIL